jgi:SAM-dependent methyltransferase
MEPTDENLRAWNAIHASRGRDDELPSAVAKHLPAVGGQHVLQLGGDAVATRALQALGALVTVVSSEPETVEDVRDHAEGAAPLQAYPDELPLELRRGRFALAYAGGVLAEVRDLRAFFAGAAAALTHGGLLLLHDEHPVALCLDEAGLTWREDYFAGRPRIGDLVDAVLGSGLELRSLEEHPSLYRWRLRNRRIPGDVIVVAAKA